MDTNRSNPAKEEFSTLTFLHFGDPQIGMSSDGILGDSERFLKLVHRANELKPDFVYIAGDLTNRRMPEEYEELYRGLSLLESQVYMVPGNHDLLGPEDVEGLKDYRERFGDDYYQFSVGTFDVICLNSITLTGLDSSVASAQQEAARQWEWLGETLASLESSKSEQRQTLVFMHIPPFVEEENETEQYFNLPLPVRQRLLALLRRHHVRTILTGHTHTTKEILTPVLTIYTVGGTALSLDDQGRGYRQWTLEGIQLEQQYVRMEL